MSARACRNASRRPTPIELLDARADRAGAVLEKRMPARCCIAFLFVFLSACGRPATQKECDEIVVRVTELELKARGVAGGDGQEVQETKEALRKSTLHDCVGRRISDKAMACVRAAQTAQQLVNECF